MHILADIGGTKIRVARAVHANRFEDPLILDTPQEKSQLPETFLAAIDRVARGEVVQKIVVGMPGWAKRVLHEDDIRAHTGASIYVENDTALVGLGEARYGAGTGSQIFVYVTISTGVNGVRIVDGKIDQSAQGFEIGGQYLAVEGTSSWEEMISGKAIYKRFGVHPKELGKNHAVWEELARVTAYGLHNTILHWSPDRVALGGSMLNDIGISVDRVCLHLESIMHKFPKVPEIVHSKLGDVGGLWGALVLLKQLRS